MPGRFFALFILFILLLALCQCGKPLPETEPANNLRKNAPSLAAGQKLTGSYYSQNGQDIDYIFIPADRTLLVRASLSPVKGVDGQLSFYRPTDENLSKLVNDNQSSLGEFSGSLLVEPPGLLVAIAPAKPVNDPAMRDLAYTFSYEVFNPLLPLELEGNDSLDRANPMPPGGSIMGAYNTAFSGPNQIEHDLFFLELPEERRYVLSAELGQMNGIDPVLRIFSPAGEQIAMADNHLVGEGEKILSLGILGPGRFYASINAKDYKTSELDFYELKFRVEPYETRSEIEPNDDAQNASLLLEESTFGQLAGSSDLDYFQHHNEQDYPELLQIEAAPNQELDLVLTVFANEKAKPLVFNDSAAGQPEGCRNYLLPAHETIFFSLSAAPGQSYSSAQAYSLVKKSSAPINNQESEPNNLPAQANNLWPETSTAAWINPNHDMDSFRIKSQKPGKYRVSISALPGCQLAAVLADRRGNRFASYNAAKAGEPLNFSTSFEPDGLLQISCSQTSENLYQQAYTVELLPDK